MYQLDKKKVERTPIIEVIKKQPKEIILSAELLEHRRLKDIKSNSELIARPYAEDQDNEVRQEQAARDAQ
jgi:hypothetical protein